MSETSPRVMKNRQFATRKNFKMGSMTLEKLLNSIDIVCQYAQEAGKIIEQFYTSQGFSVQKKADNTPVTEADWEAHLHISKKLSSISSFPIISEESYKLSDGIPNSPYWLVDPLDGTKEFINRSGDFTVNIALINDRYPILGVIYAPLTKELFFASKQAGAFKTDANGQTTKLKSRNFDLTKATLLVSRSHFHQREELVKRWPTMNIVRLGSSIKFCRIAEGSADLYVRSANTSEWDTGAGQCILEEAGGQLLDFTGQRLIYCKAEMRNDSLIAYGDKNIDFRTYLFQ